MFILILKKRLQKKVALDLPQGKTEFRFCLKKGRQNSDSDQ